MHSVLPQVAPSPELVDACGVQPTWACRRIFEATGNKALAGFVDWLVGAPLHILIIILVAVIANAIFRRAIRRFTDTISGVVTAGHARRNHETPTVIPPDRTVRAASRAKTIGSVLRSLSTAIVYSLAALTILGELGINLGPLVAGAGIAGVALGFGAQSL